MSNTKTVMGQASNQYVAPVNVEDVFSTYLYEGNGSTQTITNGLDLGGEGGLVWIKKRNESINSDHMLFDTERGPNERLRSNTTDQQYTRTDQLNSFDSSGFTLGGDSPASPNSSGKEYASWTFRKAPKFFTCLTYSGTGPGSGANEQQVSHDLGAKPGIVIIKRTDATGDWWVFTDVIDGSNDYGYLNQTAAFGNSANNVATDSVFNVGGILNTSGATYVAYLFASNDGDGGFGPTGDQDIIKCGSYTGTGAAGNQVTLGWEPQWLLIKRTDSQQPWPIVDIMRGAVANGTIQQLRANQTSAESTIGGKTSPNATGFALNDGDGEWNASGGNYIYIAIRRGPLATPEAATGVFAIDQENSSEPYYTSGFPVDFALTKNANSTQGWRAYSRLTQTRELRPETNGQEGGEAKVMFDYMDGHYSGSEGSTVYSWMWKRAPGYFDVVAYSGVGTAGRTVSHNLGVAPEMMWIKGRNYVENWAVYHKDVGATKYLMLNQTSAEATYTGAWNDTAPTSSVFTLGGWNAVNENSYNYIAYLFATLPGVSKVGSFSHTESTATNVDCGFTTGARFVLIKQLRDSRQWYVFDTARGIVSGNDKALFLNTTGAEQSFDWLTPHPAGFTVNGGGVWGTDDYIFYAIA